MVVEDQTELIFLPDGTLTFVNEAFANTLVGPTRL